MKKNIKKSLLITAFTLFSAVGMAGFATYRNAVSAKADANPLTSFTMVDGASVRIGKKDGKNGLSFILQMDATDYASMTEEGSAYSDVTFGILIAPEYYHDIYALNYDNVFGVNAKYYWDGVTDTAGKEKLFHITGGLVESGKDNDTNVYFRGSIVDILDGDEGEVNNLALDYRAVGYVKYTLNEETKYYFVGDEDNVRSMAYVAEHAISDSSAEAPSDDEKQWLSNNYIAKVDYTIKATTGSAEEIDSVESSVLSLPNDAVWAMNNTYLNDKFTYEWRLYSSESEYAVVTDGMSVLGYNGAYRLICVASRDGITDQIAYQKDIVFTASKHTAVSDFAIDADGIATFTEEDGKTYALYNGDEEVATIQSGDSIFEYAQYGDNTFTVVVKASDGYLASEKSNEAEYFKMMFGKENAACGWLGTTSTVAESYEVVTVDGVQALKANIPAGTGRRAFAIELYEPIATQAGKVNYAVITVKTPRVSPEGVTTAWFTVNNSETSYLRFSYNMAANTWMKLYVQLPENETSLTSFNYAADATNGNRVSYLYVSDVAVESFDNEITTGAGSFVVASQDGFGKTYDTWSTPYTVTEDATATVTYNEQTYTGIVTLTDSVTSFGGTTTANTASYHTGAMLKYATDSMEETVKVKLLVKISAGSKVAIAGYNGTVDKTTNIIEGTGEWQEIELTLATTNLTGITFVSLENVTGNRPAGGDFLYVGESTIEIANVEEVEPQKYVAVSDFAIDADGIATFTEEDGKTYALYSGEEEVATIQSGDSIFEYAQYGDNTFTVVVKASDGYLASEKSNEAEYFKMMFGKENAACGWLGTTSTVAESYEVVTVDGVQALKANIPAGTGRRAFAIELYEPIATQAGKVNYAVITVKTPRVSPEGVTTAWITVNNSATSYLRFSYNMAANTWMKLYIQLPENETSLTSFNYAADATNGNRVSYLYVSDVAVESFDNEITTGAGMFVVAAQDSFGKDPAKWATPYTVTEDATATVTYNEQTYTGVVTLTDNATTFGGNTATNSSTAYHTGAMLKYTTESTEDAIKVKLLVKISAGSKVAIAGYNGTVDKTTNIIEGTGEWQEIELTLATTNLTGITFVSLENVTGNRPAGGDFLYVGESTIEIANVEEFALVKHTAVSDFAIDADGIATFTEEDGKTYALYSGEEEVATIQSGNSIFEYAQYGDNTFTVVVKASDGYLASEKSNEAEYFKMMFGKENAACGWLGTTSTVADSYEVVTVDGVQALKANIPAGTGRRAFAIELYEPIATQVGKVNYAVITVKTPIVTNGITTAWFAVNNSTTSYLRFRYNMIADTWTTFYIQLPADTTELTSFNYAADSVNGNRASYLYIADVRVESFDNEITTGAGMFVVAAQDSFGKAPAKWATPYTVTEDATATVTYNEQTYTGVVTLTDNATTFGGDIATNGSTAYHTGAMLNYTTASTAETVTVKLLVKISAGSKIAIAGYNGTVDKTTNVITGTGEWQEVELTLTTASLTGITFVSLENATGNRVGGTAEYVTASTIEIANIEEIA